MEQVADEAPHSKIFFDHVRLFLSDLVFVFACQWKDIRILHGVGFIRLTSFACLYNLLAYVERFSRVGIAVGKFSNFLEEIFPAAHFYFILFCVDIFCWLWCERCLDAASALAGETPAWPPAWRLWKQVSMSN